MTLIFKIGKFAAGFDWAGAASSMGDRAITMKFTGPAIFIETPRFDAAVGWLGADLLVHGR